MNSDQYDVSEPINITSAQAVPGDYSKFSLPLSVDLSLNNSVEIALSSCNIYNSIANIHPQYNNTSFSYSNPWANSGTGATHTIDLLQGVSTGAMLLISDINSILQNAMLANGDYLTNTTTGQNIFFLDIEANPLYNNVLISATKVPTAAELSGLGYNNSHTNPMVLPPSSDATMTLTIPNTGIASVLGFPAATYPATSQSTNYFVTSPNIPQITPVTSLSLKCNLAAPNRFTNINNFLAVVPINAGSNSTIEYQPFDKCWIKCSPGLYNSIDVYIADQNGKNLSNTLIGNYGDSFFLLMRTKKK